MGSSQSCEACDLEKHGTTKSRSYVEELLQIKHANFLNLHSIESKEVLQSRRERILKALTDRKPVKPYAVQLLEARAAAKTGLPTPENFQGPNINADAQCNNLQGQNITKKPDQKSKILQRIAARRKSKRPINTSPSAVNDSSVTSVNCLPSPVDTSHVKSSNALAVNISPSPSIYTLMHPSSSKATQSDPPAQVSVLSTASQSSSLGSSVDSAIQVSPAVQSSPQQTVRLSEPKIYVQPPKPPVPKIFTLPSKRLTNRPPLSARQSINEAFSRPISSSVIEPSPAPPPPSFGDLLENICKEKLNQNALAVWKPVSVEEKRRYCEKKPLPGISSPIKSISNQKMLTLKGERPLQFDGDDSIRKRHLAAVDRLTDNLMANRTKKKTSAELLVAEEKELSLLTYGESKSSVVPHFPIRREKDRLSQRCTNHGGALFLKDSLPSVRFDKSRHSQLHCESRREIRCMRHRNNKI